MSFPPTYHATTEIFISRTGSDPGDSVELKGKIELDDLKHTISERVLGEGQHFSDNGGLGTRIAKFEKDRKFAPPEIRAEVLEDDIAWDDKIFSFHIDFTKGDNWKKANGQPQIVPFSRDGFWGNFRYKVDSV